MTTNAKEIETLVTRINIGRFSKIELLLNTTVRILKLYKQYKKSAEHSLGSAVEKNKLAVADRDSAERFWIKDAQESIAKEVREGKFIRLCPKYKDGLVVVGGRAERWIQAIWNKQKIIHLPRNHRLTNLQRMVKSICYKCITRKRRFQRLNGQVMSNLPLEQLWHKSSTKDSHNLSARMSVERADTLGSPRL